ncbi:MAG: sodium:proton antiporter [Bacteroidales bacterium]|nr:sodium:proton antiporter [Candidatus Cacconaster merdequi]
MRPLSKRESPSWVMSLTPVILLVALMFMVIRSFGADALSGGSQVALLIASGYTIAVSMFVYGCPWERLSDAITGNIKSIGQAILILLLIGAISGSWMISGIVPTFICYGLKCISPKIFLLAVCIICALVSLVTGSSWTTIATIGVAMIAIGSALGYSPAWTAGAIISGAYFGDKISPLSDTTVLASSCAGTPLFTHIRYMMITTVPSFTIALVVFLVVSLLHTAPEAAHTESVVEALESSFNITPLTLIVPVITVILIVKRIPALLTLLLAALMAGVSAIVLQPDIVSSISGASGSGLTFSSGFKGIFITYFGDTAVECGNQAMNELIATRGMNGMLQTIFLIICAATFGGTLAGSGMIKSLTDSLTKRVSSRTGLVTASVGTGIFSNMAMGDQYLSIILTCSLYKKLYDDLGYERRLLSRSSEDSATVTSVLIPWNSCGMTQSTVLHVPTLTYLPYCFFNIISPLMSILVAAIGFRIVKRKVPALSGSSTDDTRG